MIIKTGCTTIDCPLADVVNLTDDFIELKGEVNGTTLIYARRQAAVVMPSRLNAKILSSFLYLIRADKHGYMDYQAKNKLKQLKRELKGFNSVKGTWK